MKYWLVYRYAHHYRNQNVGRMRRLLVSQGCSHGDPRATVEPKSVGTKNLSSKEFPEKLEPELWQQKRNKNGIK